MVAVLSMLTAHEGRRLQSATGGAWDREARAALAVAAAHGVTLREEELVYLDVHDLQSLRWRLEHHHDVHRPRGQNAA